MPIFKDDGILDRIFGGNLIQPDGGSRTEGGGGSSYGGMGGGGGVTTTPIDIGTNIRPTPSLLPTSPAPTFTRTEVGSTGLSSLDGRINANEDPAYKYKTNSREVEIIGVQSPVTSRFVTDSGTDTGLTIQLLDITSWSEGVEFLYRNLSGGTRQIFSHTLRGKLVTRHSGTEGYLNDESLDFEDIAENGEQTLQIGNNFIFNPTQVDQLAEYHARSNFDYRHMYSCTFVGTHDWIEPGTWYTLNVGDATEEDINSVVEALSVTIERGTQGIGSTTVTFKEVLENWKPEWPTGTKFFSSGPAQRTFARGNTLRISSAQDNETADYYCDGTADDVQIQAAIDRLAASGGGTIFLSGGTFNITAEIELASNLQIIGQGIGATIINKSGDVDAVAARGTSGAYLQNIYLRDLTITQESGETFSQVLLLFLYCKSVEVQSVATTGSYFIGVVFANCESVKIVSSEITGNTVGVNIASLLFQDTTRFIAEGNTASDNGHAGIGVVTTSTSSVVSSGVIRGNVCNGNGAGGIYTAGNITGDDASSDDTIIEGNQLVENTNDGISIGNIDRRITVSGNTVIGGLNGINFRASNGTCANNRIFNTTENFATSFGLRIAQGSINCTVSANTIVGCAGEGILIETSTVNNTVVTGNRSTLNGGIADTATFTNGDATVTNADTTGFTVNDPVVLNGDQIGTIAGITSGVEFELSAAFTGTTGSYYYRVLDANPSSDDNYLDNGTNTTDTGNDFT